MPCDESIQQAHAPGALAFREHALQRFLAVCHRRRYPTKTAIFRPGDSRRTLYYVVDGSLAVSSEDDDGRELILAYLNKGEFIGEMGLFVETAAPRSAGAHAARLRAGRDQLRAPVRLFEGTAARRMRRASCSRSASQLTHRLLHTSRKVSPPGLHGCHRPRRAHAARPVRGTRCAVAPAGHADPHLAPGDQPHRRLFARDGRARAEAARGEQGKIAVKGKTIVVFGTR